MVGEMEKARIENTSHLSEGAISMSLTWMTAR